MSQTMQKQSERLSIMVARENPRQQNNMQRLKKSEAKSFQFQLLFNV